MHQDEKNYLREMKKTRDRLVCKHQALSSAMGEMLTHWPSYQTPELRTEAAAALEKTMDDVIEVTTSLDHKIAALEKRKLNDLIETKIAEYEAKLEDHVGGEDDHTYLSGKISAYEEMLKELEA